MRHPVRSTHPGSAGHPRSSENGTVKDGPGFCAGGPPPRFDCHKRPQPVPPPRRGRVTVTPLWRFARSDPLKIPHRREQPVPPPSPSRPNRCPRTPMQRPRRSRTAGGVDFSRTTNRSNRCPRCAPLPRGSPRRTMVSLIRVSVPHYTGSRRIAYARRGRRRCFQIDCVSGQSSGSSATPLATRRLSVACEPSVLQ